MNHQNCFEVHFKIKPPIKSEKNKAPSKGEETSYNGDFDWKLYTHRNVG